MSVSKFSSSRDNTAAFNIRGCASVNPQGCLKNVIHITLLGVSPTQSVFLKELVKDATVTVGNILALLKGYYLNVTVSQVVKNWIVDG